MRRLGVNIDHIATLRNARGELHPDPIFAAKFVKKAGAPAFLTNLAANIGSGCNSPLAFLRVAI